LSSFTFIGRIPRRLASLAKRYLLAVHNSLSSKIEQMEALSRVRMAEARGELVPRATSVEVKPKDEAPAHPKDQVFSSRFISLPDAAKFEAVLERGYRDERIIQVMIKLIRAHTMVGYEGVATLIDQARYCEEEGIVGAFVEVGTCMGGCLAAMAHSNLVFGRARRQIHGFDSFEGIPKPRLDKDDIEWAVTEMKLKPEDCDGSLQPANSLIAAQSDVEAVFDNVRYPREYLKLHVGWFQDTVPPAAASIGPIAILRLDGDLYDSYMVALDHLWDLVVPGGFIVFDDWVLKGCRDAVTEFFAKRGIRQYLNIVDHSVRYIQKTA